MKSSCLKCLFFLFFGSSVLGTQAIQKDNTVGVGNGVVDGSYIGGLNSYDPSSYTVYNGKIPTPTVTVTSVPELKAALQKAVNGDVIYLKDDAQFDLSDSAPLKLATNVTICSGRGINKSLGALVFSNNLKSAPMFLATSNVKIIGLRIQGPDGNAVNTPELGKARTLALQKDPSKKIDTTDFKVYGIPNSYGIMVVGKGAKILDCEISNWSYAGIFVRKDATGLIEHNYIHHCQRYGLGYGVLMQMGYARIRGNLFDYNRHAIAGTGEAGTSYTADFNVSLPHSTLQGHIFDMHGGTDRKDGTTVAGDSIKINNNLFFVKDKTSPAIRVRGIPRFNSTVYNNSFVIVKDFDFNARKFQQNNAHPVQMNQISQSEQWVKHTLDVHGNNFYDGD